jgi:NTE family protein
MNNSLQHDSQTTSNGVSRHMSHRALVLGGGGSTGNAWLIGVIAGLFDAGLDVTTADLTIGTSAGATAAAQIAGATTANLYELTVAAVPQQRSGPTRPVVDHLARVNAIIASSADAVDMRRRMGRSSLDLDAVSDRSWQEKWRATVAARLPGQLWPERAVNITAVDAESGEGVVFDLHSGVDLVDAVAASCSSGIPFRIGGHQYIDGGYRTNAENADLAAGYGRVLVLSPFGGRSLVPAEWGVHLATQVEELRAGGSRVETIFPNSASEHLFGVNGMDLSLRPAAAQAGYDQGRVLADELGEFWG